MRKRIVLRPIGWVWNQVPGSRYSDWEDVVSEIVLDDDLAAALDGIEGYSHIVVLFYMTGITARQRATLRLHPEDRQDLPEVGIFATRTQYRPNPIGVTVVRLLQRRGNVLRVAGLDTYNGTPVIDIKAYLPDAELAQESRIPDWLQRLRSSSQITECPALNRGAAENAERSH